MYDVASWHYDRIVTSVLVVTLSTLACMMCGLMALAKFCNLFTKYESKRITTSACTTQGGGGSSREVCAYNRMKSIALFMLTIPKRNSIRGVCCFGSVYAYDHGRVSGAAGIRGDSREYRISHFADKSHVKNWR